MIILRIGFVLAMGIACCFPSRAEDWTTNDGKIYQNVRVLSQTPAYVTILHQDGGGEIPLSKLSPELQHRFNYTPAAAAQYLAATAAAVQANKDALAREKARVAAQDAQREEANAEAFYIALFTIPSDRDVTPPAGVASAAQDEVPAQDVASGPTPIESEPPSEVDDFGWGTSGYYGSGIYSGYGYGGYYGYPRHRGWSTHHGTRSFTRGSRALAIPMNRRS